MNRLVLASTILVVTACGLFPNFPSAATPTPIVIPDITPTYEPTPTPIVVTPTVNPTQETISEGTYLVQTGDTLGKIAAIAGIPLDYLAEVNGITNLDLILAGTYLIIPKWPPNPPVPDTTSEKEIIVVLSTQTACAAENGQIVKCVLVSTGIPGRETPLGHYRVYAKVRFLNMSGEGYSYPDVPWNLCFLPTNDGYCIHGTYWHNNFGQVMSHGCVNLSITDAEWFYNWADKGTLVWVKK